MRRILFLTPTAVERLATHSVEATRPNWNLTFSQGDGLDAAAMALRHSDSVVTDQHYVKVTGQERRTQREGRKLATVGKRNKAARVLGSGLKKDRVN
ncbi:MAG TPA: hypothetical protein VNW97_10940 [Candidatus Saccharimonadales bacterium]|nr:hypothetical protein [Candidatus Saccharimonadales bacterium]